MTHADHVVTNGFIISEIGDSGVDSDGDGVNDGEELLRNELTFVLRRALSRGDAHGPDGACPVRAARAAIATPRSPVYTPGA